MGIFYSITIIATRKKLFNKKLNLTTKILMIVSLQQILGFLLRHNLPKHCKSCEKLPWELVGCQGVKVFFTKRCHYNYFCHYCNFYYHHNLSFWVVTIFFLFLHNLSFFSFVTIWSFKFCHNLFFLSLSQFEFFTIWVFEFCHI